jgi:cyanophycin synthetase
MTTPSKDQSCQDCGQPNSYHLASWLEELLNYFFSPLKPPERLEAFFNFALEKILIHLCRCKLREDPGPAEIPLKTFLFCQEMKKRGAICFGFQSRFGWLNLFRINLGKKTFLFEGLPTANLKSQSPANPTNDKWQTKKLLQNQGLPVAEGKAFWFWQKKEALGYGQKLGFPLVVKPRQGSLSRHVTTDIKNAAELEKAIAWAVIFAPTFMIEKCLSQAFVHRATVVDFDFVAVDKRLPANVTGDGISTVRQLVEQKNRDPKRGPVNQKQFSLHPLVFDETAKKLLEQKGYGLETVLKESELVYLQKDSFLRLGGDVIEVTNETHLHNLELFRQCARLFDGRLVGIDFLCQDIARSWTKQTCAVLELNGSPAFESHHFPVSGTPQNVAAKIADLFFEYYL